MMFPTFAVSPFCAHPSGREMSQDMRAQVPIEKPCDKIDEKHSKVILVNNACGGTMGRRKREIRGPITFANCGRRVLVAWLYLGGSLSPDYTKLGLN